MIWSEGMCGERRRAEFSPFAETRTRTKVAMHERENVNEVKGETKKRREGEEIWVNWLQVGSMGLGPSEIFAAQP